MRPRLATVASPSRWEPRLVAAVRSTGLARLVGRFADPGSLADAEPDVIAFDAGVPWIGGETVRRWRERSIVTLGFATGAGRGAARLLTGCDLVFDEEAAPGRILAALVAITPPAPVTASSPGLVIPVVGARGAPGCTEVAVTLAALLANRGTTLLTESDPAAPGLGMRLGLPPVHGRQLWRGVHVQAGPGVRSALVRRIGRAAGGYDHVVIDAGASGAHWPDPQRPVLVVDPSPAGLARAAALVEHWTGSTPMVVVNRAGSPADPAVLRRVRAAVGLEPTVVAGLVPIEWPAAPSDGLVDALTPILDRLCDQEPAALL